MEIWLNNGNDKIRFPILPSEFKIEESQQNTSENVHRKGEINLLGEKNLATVELNSFFPSKDYVFCQYHGFNTNPYYYINKIKGWKENKETPQLIITGNPNINMNVSIEAFSYGEDDGSGDVTFSISLKEYVVVRYSTPAKKTTASGKKVKKKAAAKKKKTKNIKTSTYKVKRGDTLWSIAKKKTGSSTNWKKIYKKNKTVIEKAARNHGRKSSSNGHWIYPGTKLVIEK